MQPRTNVVSTKGSNVKRVKPATILASLALFFSLGGVGYAANHYLITSTHQIKPSVLKQLHGKRGPAGPQGVIGFVGANGSNGAQGLTGPVGPKGDTGAPGATGAMGASGTAAAQGATGPAGNAGPAGADGATGSPGPKGDKGDTGATGPQGEQGEQGPQGNTGATGAQGPQGNQGPAGADGPRGASNPLVFGPYNTPNDQDSNTCGGNWATDNFDRTYIVTPQPDGSFDITELYNGTFTTNAGESQPNPASCPGTLETGGVFGHMYGEYVLNLAAPADFNPTATCSAACGTSDFFADFFHGASEPANYAWEFYYTTPSNGDWSNTDHGNTGNITG